MLHELSIVPQKYSAIQYALLLEYSTDNNLYIQYTLTWSQILGSALDPKSNWTI